MKAKATTAPDTTDLMTLANVRELARSGTARALREEAGLSISEMATAIGVAVSTLWRWENGERSPKGRAALDYASVLSELRVRGLRL